MSLAFWYGGNLLVSGEIGPVQIFVVFIAIVSGGEAAGELFAKTNSAQNSCAFLASQKPDTI